jgi:hypothetical protein
MEMEMEKPSVSDTKKVEFVETLATVIEKGIKNKELSENKELIKSKDLSEIKNEVANIEEKASETIQIVEIKADEKAEDINKILDTINDDNKLTAEQKIIIKSIYENVKDSVEGILNAKDVDSAIKITQTIATVIKLVEKITINNKPISGASKKLLALELVRTLINDLIKDDSIKNSILAMYDMIGESTLEMLVDVSRNINIKNVVKATTNCCAGFFSLFSKKCSNSK